MAKISSHQALIHIMVTMSAADRSMTDKEFSEIGTLVKTLPVFAGYDIENLVGDASACSSILQNENGLETIIKNAKDSLLPHLYETAYAIAVDVAAADLKLEQEELRLLQILRDQLGIDRLACVAIERGARARHQTL